MLFQHPHIGHDHAAVGRLAHVVNGEQGNLYGGQCLHFHPSLAHRIDLGAAMNGRLQLVDFEFHRHPRDRQRMAQRHQITGALGAHDGGNSCYAENIAFASIAFKNNSQGFRLHDDGAGSYGNAVRVRLAAHVHHVGLTGRVEMGEGRGVL